MIRLGMLTPSSNTVLEPVTAAMLAGAPGFSMHAARFKVTEISLGPQGLAQFDATPILAAADLLSHAKVDVITWNGTSASWLGLEADHDLVARIETATAIPAATCMLGYFDWFRARGVRRLGLVTPYTDDVVARIRTVYAAQGVTVTVERHLGICDNFTFATVQEAPIAAMIRACAVEGPDAIAVICTNLNAARLCAQLEQDLGVPILDSVAMSLWASLARLDLDPVPFRAWGTMFAPQP